MRGLIERRSAVFLALVCIVLWSFIPVVSKLGQTRLDSIQFLFWSNVLSALTLLAAVDFKQHKLTDLINATNIKFSILLGFLGCFFYYLCLYFAYARYSGLAVLVVQYSWPALTAIIAVFILSERLTWRKVIAITLGFLAVILVISKGSIARLGDIGGSFVLLVVLIGAFSFALFSVLSKKEERLDAAFAIFLYFFWATLFSLAAVLLMSNFTIPSVDEALPVLANGVLINGLSYLFWISALAKADASKIAPLVYIAPVISALWLVLFFDEVFMLAYAVAIVFCIISGLLIVQKRG